MTQIRNTLPGRKKKTQYYGGEGRALRTRQEWGGGGGGGGGGKTFLIEHSRKLCLHYFCFCHCFFLCLIFMGLK